MLVWLAYYPELWNYDPWQVLQFTQNDYNKHHPLIHTVFLGFCYSVGLVLAYHNPHLTDLTIRFLYAALFCHAWQMFRFTGTAEEQTQAAGELRPLLHKLAKTGRNAIFSAHHTASSDTRSNSAS